MIRKMLYRTKRDDGGYQVSPQRPPSGDSYQVRWRLIAEEGMAITDGTQTVTVIDLVHRKDCEAWSDCEMLENDRVLPQPPQILFSEGK